MNIQRQQTERGFSMVEMLIAFVMVSVIAGFSILQINRFMRSYRALSDARSIASQLASVKMRAASGFTQARLNCDLTGNSCLLETCTTKSTSTCTTFTAEGARVLLSEGSSFGYGSLTTPAGTQTSIQNTAQILFNSRSVPVDSTGTPTGNYALYITNGSGDRYAVTVYATGRLTLWRSINGTWTLQ